MRGLAFLRRTSDRRCWNLVAFHSPHSLTWSWIVSWHWGENRRFWPLWWTYRTNHGLQWGVRIPFVGHFCWSRQRPMFYRDLYQRLRNEKDGFHA